MSIWLLALILGLIEGITEFIPVSSTGHLLLAENLLGIGKNDFLSSEVFNAFIQVWAVLAALPLFRDRLATLREWRKPENRDYFLKILVAFVITGAGGLTMKKMGLKLPESAIPVMVALAVGGLLFLLIERGLHTKKQTAEISWRLAVFLGLAQLLAVAFPGTSRSGATIIIALMCGAARPAATEFSFLLGIPTLCAAGAKTLWDAHKEGIVIQWGPMALASLAAAISSILAVRWLLGYVRNHSFSGFGWYRIALSVVFLGFYFAGWIR